METTLYCSAPVLKPQPGGVSIRGDTTWAAAACDGTEGDTLHLNSFLARQGKLAQAVLWKIVGTGAGQLRTTGGIFALQPTYLVPAEEKFSGDNCVFQDESYFSILVIDT